MSLLIEFEKFPEEKRLIGEMLMAYGEIEFGIAVIVADILGQNAEAATKILFRVKGESPRLEVADGIISPPFRKRHLDGHWNNAYGVIKHCKNIRN